MSASTRIDRCRLCGSAFEQLRRRGRPRELCPSCRSKSAKASRIAAKKRAYYEENRESIAAKKRAYYEENRESIAAKQRAYSSDRKLGLKTVTCVECGEHLARRTEDGLCGFCRQGIPAEDAA